MDTDISIVKHIINNHSIASLKQFLDNQLFATAANIGLLVVGNFYKLEVFIPYYTEDEAGMLALFKADSGEEDHVYFSYDKNVKSRDLSRFMHMTLNTIVNNGNYEFTRDTLIFKFTPCYIPQNSQLGQAIFTHTFVTVRELYTNND